MVPLFSTVRAYIMPPGLASAFFSYLFQTSLAIVKVCQCYEITLIKKGKGLAELTIFLYQRGKETGREGRKYVEGARPGTFHA